MDRDCKQIVFAKRKTEICLVLDTVEVIGAYAFCQCGKLQGVRFGEDPHLRRIDAYAFFATALTWIQIPPSVTVIGEAAFASCHHLSDFRFFPESQLVELGRRAFGQTALTSFHGPSRLEKVGASLFSNSKIQTVIFQEHVEALPSLLFFRCGSLERVILKSTGNVTAHKTAFDETNPALQIYVKHRDKFQGPEGLRVTEDIAEDMMARLSEVYERASRLSSSLDAIVLKDGDRTVVPSWLAKEGKYGRVAKAKHVVTGEISAVKTFKNISSKYDPAKQKELFMREIEAMKKLIHHPAILGLIGFIPPSTIRPGAGVVGEIHCGKIVTEFMPNDTLSSLIANPDYANRSPTLKVKIAVGIAAAMRYMHEKGIVHRDLKPLNILLDDRWEPRLADFGSARAGDWELAFTLTAEVGTVLWAAPETYSATVDGSPCDYGPAVDVYSYGITLWEIITGIPMNAHFNKYTPYGFQQMVKEKHLRPPLNLKGVEIIPWVADLLGRCWDGEPNQRPTFDGILQEFRAHRFELLPETDAGQIDVYLSAIQEYEREHPVPHTG